ncbi:MAG: hypothetical protein M0O96_06430 [Desulforhopalus sp.]|nr:hypothetical protein [Desulforhopalus sp.]
MPALGFLVFLSLFFFTSPLLASSTGMYGVDRSVSELEQYGVERVWMTPDHQRIATETALDRQVFLTLNIFGGSGGWQKFPDAVPVLADGTLMPARFGGMCPSHEGWRRQRLELLHRWVEEYGGRGGISGIWLDFIRYPGHWEEREPQLFDTCWCDRCLTRFQKESGVTLPAKLQGTAAKSAWIKANAATQWYAWKQGLILSFVTEAKQILHSGSKPLKLGLFLVPWRKSDFNGAVITLLGQNAAQLAAEADVISPMTYHRMCGRSEPWIGEVTSYFKEIAADAGAELWPILQAEEMMPGGFSDAVSEAERGGADGLMIYSLHTMQPWQWPIFAGFSPQKNLLGELHSGEGQVTLQGNLEQCRPGTKFLFAADFFRASRNDSTAYPEVELWGKRYRLNTHRLAGEWQRIKVQVSCPEESHGSSFKFLNRYPSTPFSMRRATLKLWVEGKSPLLRSAAASFFPLGSYGGSVQNLAAMQKLGLNTAMVGLSHASVEKCLQLKMSCTFNVPHDPQQLISVLNENEELLKQGHFSFYVNDEPSLRGVPSWKTEDIQRLLKSRFPDFPTMMAVVRPQTVPFYNDGADYFMLDQYPVPDMPMTWLPDSMDIAAAHVGRSRLMAVIQAFGGGDNAVSGWSRLPTAAEMYDLAMLSVIHGSRGIWFYTWDQINRTLEGKRDFAWVVQRLAVLKPWLQAAENTRPEVYMTSPYSKDAAGNPAVHCALKGGGEGRMLICANTLRYGVRANVVVDGTWGELFSKEKFSAGEGQLDLPFAAFEVRTLVEKR